MIFQDPFKGWTRAERDEFLMNDRLVKLWTSERVHCLWEGIALGAVMAVILISFAHMFF